MKTTHGPNRIVALPIEPGVELDMFRIVRSRNTEDPVFLNSLRSHYALSEEPRKVEREWAVLHLTLWADPVKLQSATTDIHSVDRYRP
jgi:hypothetical protein